MTSIIDHLNAWGGHFVTFAWPMLWQSSLLIALVFAGDILLARKVRASVRHGLWLVVLAKLLLPPTLALPTSAAWWLFPAKPTVVATPLMPVANPSGTDVSAVVLDDSITPPDVVQDNTPVAPPPRPKLERTGWMLLAATGISAGLICWLLVRWWQLGQRVRSAARVDGPAASGNLAELLEQARRRAGLRAGVRLRLVDGRMSPAVCGLFRPVILLPRLLVEQLSPAQLQAVLLHEMIHLRRRDIWVNCAQSLLQIFYWWHPLLWVANARIRRVREEAVDDAVMLALAGDAETYAPTLLEVAKLAFRRPLLSLGLVGIMESRSALRQRIERLVDFRAPRKAGLTVLSVCGIFVFSAVAVPMGQGPAAEAEGKSRMEDGSSGTAEVLAANTPATATGTNTQAASTTWPSPLQTQNSTVEIPNVSVSEPTVLSYQNKMTTFRSAENDDSLAHEPEVVTALVGNTITNVNISHFARLNADGSLDTNITNVSGLLLAQADQPASPAPETAKHVAEATATSAVSSSEQNTNAPQVLIDAQIYRMSPTDFQNLVSGLSSNTNELNGDMWWSASPNEFASLGDQLKKLGVKPLTRPRILTTSSKPATIYVGDDTNGILLDCAPTVAGDTVNMEVWCKATEPSGNTALTNKFHANAEAKNHGGIAIRLESAEVIPVSNYVAFIGLQIITNGPGSHFQQRLNRIEKHVLQVHIKAHFIAVQQGTNDSQPLSFGSQSMSFNWTNADSPQLTGILTSQNLKTLLKGLSSNPGTENLGEPEITTSSGRQTEMRATVEHTIVTGATTSLESLTATPQTTTVETGPILDVIPRVSDDGYAINLRLTPSLIEFVGYEKQEQAKNANGISVTPEFKTQTLTTDLNLWDGQTVLLGGFKDRVIQTSKDKVPVAGDIPLIGRLFQSESTNVLERNVLILITANIVDETGSLVHSDSEMQRMEEGVPPQPTNTDTNFSGGVQVITSNTPPAFFQQRLQRISKPAGTNDGANTLESSGHPVVEDSSPSSRQLTKTFALNGAKSEDAVRQFLLDAGVEMPPTTFLYADDGLLVVRGTPDQLALVYQAASKWNGFPPQNNAAGHESFTQELALKTTDESTNILNRTFRVNTNQFLAYFETHGESDTNATTPFRNLFNQMGLNFDRGTGKSIFYNARLGLLFVRATTSDLDTVESVVQAIQQTNPPAMHFQQRLQRIGEPAGTNEGAGTGMEQYGHQVGATSSTSGSAPGHAPDQLHLRTFTMYTHYFQTNYFLGKLQSQGLVTDLDSSTNISHTVSVALQKLFTDAGVDLTTPPGKSVYYNSERGQVFVKATEADLNKVEKALQLFLPPAPQLHIKARFINVPAKKLASLEKYLPAISPTNSQFTQILTGTNIYAVLRTLGEQKGVEYLGEPEITLLRGRQTQMRATTVVSFPTNIVPDVNATNSGDVINTQVGTLETGPIFNVSPRVMEDGYTIHLPFKATVTEFFGFANWQGFPRIPYTNSAGKAIGLPRVWPAADTLTQNASANLYDDQTFVMALSRAQAEQIRYADPDPKREAVVAKYIDAAWEKQDEPVTLVFVTATIVDPAGSRVHSEGELPFAPDAIPPQPAAGKVIEDLDFSTKPTPPAPSTANTNSTAARTDSGGQIAASKKMSAPQVDIKVHYYSVPGTNMIFDGWNMSAESAFTAIVNEPGAEMEMGVLESRKGVITLEKQEAKVSAGGRAELFVGDVLPVVTNMVYEENQTNSGSIEPRLDNLQTGRALNLVARVEPDGYTVHLPVKAMETEFFGYADVPKKPGSIPFTNSADKVVELPRMWPAANTLTQYANVNLYDGQTFVMALNSAEAQQIRYADPDPEREEAVAKHIAAARKKEHNPTTLVFMTVNIIDATGAKVHSDADLPFAPNEIPPQPTAVKDDSVDFPPYLIKPAKPSANTNTTAAVTDVRSNADFYAEARRSLAGIDAAATGSLDAVSWPVEPQEAKLIQDGKLLYEQGKYSEAETKLSEAARTDPANATAYYYLNLTRQAETPITPIQQTIGTASLPASKPYATNQLIFTGAGRQQIMAKLDTVHLDNVSWDSVPLTEVLRQLAEQSRLRDPQHKGINFLINNSSDQATPMIDSATGQPPAPASGTETPDVGSYLIKIPSLTDVRMADVLNAIVLVSDHRLKYSVQDFAVVFSAKTSDEPQLFMRTFRVDPNTFYSGLANTGTRTFGAYQNSGSGSSGNQQNNGTVVGTVNPFAGGSDQQNGITPQSVQYNPPVQTPSAALRSYFQGLGIDLLHPPGKSVFFNDKLGYLFVKATESDLNTIERALQKLNTTPPQVLLKSQFFEAPKGTLRELNQYWNLNNASSAHAEGILTSKATALFTQMLQSKNGIEPLGAPAVTTITGRQVQMRVDSSEPQQIGPVLDIIPYVLADGYTINLATIPSSGQNQHSGKSPVVSTANIWDNQTFLLGLNYTSAEGVTGSQIQNPNTEDKELLVLVTATVIDSTGKRVHSDDELPSAQKEFPVQPNTQPDGLKNMNDYPETERILQRGGGVP